MKTRDSIVFFICHVSYKLYVIMCETSFILLIERQISQSVLYLGIEVFLISANDAKYAIMYDVYFDVDIV